MSIIPDTKSIFQSQSTSTSENQSLGNSINKIQSQHLNYLDGVRGLAILLVLICHAAWFTYGFIGVWLFFGLSGYLISQILLKNKESKNYYWVFYARRFLRITPLYLITITFAFLYFKKLLPLAPSSLSTFSIYLFYLQGFVGFFSINLLNPVLGYTWSLAIEEHFYLLLPIGIKKFFSAQTLEIFCLHLMWIGPLSRQILFLSIPQIKANSYSYSFLSLEVFAYGVWLSARQFQNKTNSSAFLILAGLNFIFLILNLFIYPIVFKVPPFWTVAYGSQGGLVIQPIFHLMPPLCGLFLAAVFNFSFLQRILTFKPLVWTGNLSYALYLFHGVLLPMPFIQKFATSLQPFVWIPISYILAIVSRYCFELPMLSLKKYFVFASNKESYSGSIKPPEKELSTKTRVL